MTEKTETCYFLQPQSNRCAVFDEECSESRSCSFRRTEREFYEQRNRAVEINRARGNCAKCKYKLHPCETIKIGGENSCEL